MIQDTSLEVFYKLKNLGDKQKAVLDLLRLMPDATNAEIADKLGWPINRVTPRCNELRKVGLVLDAGKRTCKITGSTAHMWKAKYPALPPAFKPVEPKPQTLFP